MLCVNSYFPWIFLITKEMREVERKQIRPFCIYALLACFLPGNIRSISLNSTPTIRLAVKFLSQGLQCSVNRELGSLTSHVNSIAKI